MGSRYALREIEGAIGYDCRRLDDGRRALFRHTFIHNRVRRDFRERRDVMMVLAASYLANSAFASRPDIGLDNAMDVIRESKSALLRSAFPHLRIDEPKPESSEDFDRYFDELDEIEAAAKAKGQENDIIDKEK